MSRNFKTKGQYFICFRSGMTSGTNFAFNLRTSTSKTPNLRARVIIIIRHNMYLYILYTLRLRVGSVGQSTESFIKG